MVPGVELIHLDLIAAIILYRQPELGSLDAQRRVLGDQRRRETVVVEIEATRQNPVIVGRRIEHVRHARRADAVQLDSETAATGRATASRKPPVREAPSSSRSRKAARALAPTSSNRVFLSVEFLDDDERKDHLVFVEAEDGVRIGQKNAGIQDVGSSHRSTPSP